MDEHEPIVDPTPDSPDWAGMAGGPADPSSLVALAGADPEAMTGPALVDAIVASEKALSFLAGKQMRLLTAFAKPFKAGDPTRLAKQLARKNCITGDDDPEQVAMYVPEAAQCLAAAEVAAALRIPTVTAGHRVHEATTMTGVLAPTLHALETGVLDRGKARVIADHCTPLSPEHTTKVQELVLPTAGDLNTSELREVTGQAVITVDPDGAEERHRAAAARRELALQALPDAMASLKAYLPADGAVKIFQISDLLATGTAGAPGDTRGIGARRVDALVDIADQLLSNGYLDLTEYLGTELPDHGTPPTRTRTATGTNADTDPADAADAADADADTAASAAAATTTNDAGETPDGDVDEKGDVEVGVRVEAQVNADAHEPEPEVGGQVTEPTISDRAAEAPEAGAGDVGSADTETEGDTTAEADIAATATDDTADGGDDIVVDDVQVDPETADEKNDVADLGVQDSGAAESEVAESKKANAEPAAPAPTPTAPTAATAKPVKTDKTDNTSKSGKAGKPGNTGRVFTRQGRRPHLNITLGLGTLAGLNNLPGTLAGFGAIPASLARSIAASAGTINALLTNPDTGTITAAGALTYRPTQELRDHIAAISNVCRFPSCRQPVWRCDMDHRETFNHEHPERGGKTTPENTGPFCRRHHLIKHHSQWKLRPDPDRTVLHFTSPTGHKYTKRGQQTAPPAMWITTAGTAIAEHLDTITPTVTEANPPPAPGSSIEELLTTILIQHALNTRPLEYQHDNTDWDSAAEQWDDPPPF